MEKLRPHHVVCLTRLHSAISLFKLNEELYFNAIKEELKFSTNLRLDQLDCCKVTWGTIYSIEVMQVLSKVLDDKRFITSDNTCDSICSACYGKIDGKCVGEDRIQVMDSIATRILNHQTNVVKSTENLDNPEFDKLCNICGTKDKCNLIRKAVSKVLF